jgi:hypothetical protein
MGHRHPSPPSSRRRSPPAAGLPCLLDVPMPAARGRHSPLATASTPPAMTEHEAAARRLPLPAVPCHRLQTRTVQRSLRTRDGKAKIADSVLFLSAYQTPDSGVSSEPVCANDTRSIVAKSTDHPNWSVPSEGWIRLNTDGFFLAKDCSADVGFMAWDLLGGVAYTWGLHCWESRCLPRSISQRSF